MNSKRKFRILSSALCVIILTAVYFLLAVYYRDGFCVNTWINGVYCTGKTVNEISEELLSKTEAPIVLLTDKDDNTYSIDFSQLDYREDYLSSLQDYKHKQNSLLWIQNIFFYRNQSKSHKILPKIQYDELKLREAVDKLPFVEQEKSRIRDYLIVKNWTDGYLLYDGLSRVLDTDKLYEVIKSAIANDSPTVNLEDSGCYYDIPLSEEQMKVKELWDKINDFQTCSLVYDMGDRKIPFASVIMAEFLQTENGVPVLDEWGNVVLSEAKISNFVKELAQEYDTYGKSHQFQSTRGDLISIKGGTYGTEINQKQEVAFLMEHLLDDEFHGTISQVHIPSYSRETAVHGKNDIGSTYVEIDMTEQKLYYYQNGQLLFESEIVTGNLARGCGTPEGVNYVYNKQKNRILRGPGYASPVKFWMPVKGGIGIHDASWRSKFGGEIYKKSGSHGCINVPKDRMEELYQMVEVGTPVVMFY